MKSEYHQTEHHRLCYKLRYATISFKAMLEFQFRTMIFVYRFDNHSPFLPISGTNQGKEVCNGHQEHGLQHIMPRSWPNL